MSKILVALLISVSVNFSAYADSDVSSDSGKYDDCISVGEMARDFMGMMQSGLTLTASLKKIKGVYTSDDGSDAGERFAFQMMERMYQQYSFMPMKRDRKDKIDEYEQEMVRQCYFLVDRREKQELESKQPKLHG